MIKFGQIIFKSLATFSQPIVHSYDFEDITNVVTKVAYTFHSLRQQFVMEIIQDDNIDNNESIMKNELLNIEKDPSFVNDFDAMVLRINNIDPFIRIDQHSMRILKNIDTSIPDITSEIKKQLLAMESTIVNHPITIESYRNDKIQKVTDYIHSLQVIFNDNSFLQNFDVNQQLNEWINNLDVFSYISDSFGGHENFFKDIDKLKLEIDSRIMNKINETLIQNNNLIINNLINPIIDNVTNEIEYYFSNNNVFQNTLNTKALDLQNKLKSMNDHNGNRYLYIDNYVTSIIDEINLFKSWSRTYKEQIINEFVTKIRGLTAKTESIADDEFTNIINSIISNKLVSIVDIKKIFNTSDDIDKYSQIYCDLEEDQVHSTSSQKIVTFKFLQNGHEYYKKDFTFHVLNILDKINDEILKLNHKDQVDDVILNSSNWSVNSTSYVIGKPNNVETVITGYIDLVNKYTSTVSILTDAIIEDDNMIIRIKIIRLLDQTQFKIINIKIPYHKYNNYFRELGTELTTYVNSLNFQENNLLEYAGKNFIFDPTKEVELPVSIMLPDLIHQTTIEYIKNKEIHFRIIKLHNSSIASTSMRNQLDSFFLSAVIVDKYSTTQSNILLMQIKNITSLIESFKNLLRLRNHIFDEDIQPLLGNVETSQLKYIFNNYYMEDMSGQITGIYSEFAPFLEISQELNHSTSNNNEYILLLHIKRRDNNYLEDLSFIINAIESNPIDYLAQKISMLNISNKIQPNDDSLLQHVFTLAELDEIFIGYKNLYNEFQEIGIESIVTPVYKNVDSEILMVDFTIQRPTKYAYKKIISLPITSLLVTNSEKQKYIDSLNKAIENVSNSDAFKNLSPSDKQNIQSELDELKGIPEQILGLPFISENLFNKIKDVVSQKLNKVINDLYHNIHNNLSNELSQKLNLDSDSLPKDVSNKLNSILNDLKTAKGLEELSKLDFSEFSLDKIISAINYNSNISYPMLIIVCSILGSLALISLVLLINSIRHYKISNRASILNSSGIPKISKIKWIIALSLGMFTLLIVLSILLILLI